MKKLAVCIVMLAAMPATAQTSPAQEEAVRTLITGTWTCKGIGSGVNISTTTNYRPGGSFQSTMYMTADQLNLQVAIEGTWVVKGFKMQQAFTSVGNFTGSLNGAAVTPAANADLVKGIKELAPEAEAIALSDRKFTLTDSEGTVTTCTR